MYQSTTYNWKGVLLWHSILYILGEPLRDILLTGDTSGVIDSLSLKSILLHISGYLSWLIYSLGAYTMMYYLYPRKKWLALSLSIVFIILIAIAFRNILEQHLYPAIWGFQNYQGVWTIKEYIHDNLYFAFRYVLLGILYYVINYAFQKERKSRALELANKKMELDLLRSQVNPHFLLNSLNNVYSLVYQKSDKALIAIDKLSDLLKYSLYESKEYVAISEELDIIEKYIDLQGMRYDFPIRIEKNIAPGIEHSVIPQMTLLPLVENAFKHGDLREGAINIDVKYDGVQLILSVKNKIGKITKDKTGGIGLDNLNKRLILNYGEGSSLNTETNDDYFIASVSIPVA